MIRASRITVKLIKGLVLAGLALTVALGAFLGYLAAARNQPLRLPAPTGSYPVGRLVYDWTDLARIDPLADQGSPARELVIWVWYPSAISTGTPAPYLPPAWVKARNRDQGIGVLVESSFTRIQAYSYEGAPLAAAPATFPVLIMEPGMGPITTDYTVFAETLASHGYIVVGINPTYTANWTVFPDGRVAPRSTIGAIPDSDSPEEANVDASRILAVWTADVKFVLDQLGKVDSGPSSPFYNRLDLERIGIWGHSFGGATALSVCQTDPRCKAGADLDGTPFGEERQRAVARPFLFMTEDYRAGCDMNCELIHQAYLQAQPSAAYFLSVTGAAHFNFSDLPFRHQPALRPLFTLSGVDGTIAPERGLQITRAYLVAFFDQYLKGTQEVLLQGPSPAYPEVTFEKR